MTEIHLISLGAGVQSSTMALMAAAGEITPMPYAAIFADTGAEPASVYRWLDWLENKLPFPVIRVCQGDGLEADALKVRQKKDGSGSWIPSAIPYFSINSDGSHGQGPRQCTHDFKLAPLMRQARICMSATESDSVIWWIGISLDEAHRMKPSRVGYSKNMWPLIDKRMHRRDCLRWMRAKGFPTPPRSACVFCPYHSDSEWRRMRDEEPEEFQKAVEFERRYRAAKASTVNFVPYLHASRVPLDQVDFSTDEDQGQQLLFGNECEGLCGV